jgi:hypothetical protein
MQRSRGSRTKQRFSRFGTKAVEFNEAGAEIYAKT